MCMIEDCDEQYTVYRQQVLKAKKQHKCTECKRVIERGETYRRTAGLYDGEWTIGKVCAHCKTATDWLKANCGGYLDHSVLEDMEQHFEEYSRMDLARVVVGMRRSWKRIRSDGLMRPLPIPRPLKLGDARD